MMWDSSATLSHPFQEPWYPNSWRLQWVLCHLEILQDIGENTWEKMTTVVIYFCGLSFCMVRKVHGGCPKHQARYILLKKRGARNMLEYCIHDGPSCWLSELLAEFWPMPTSTHQENAQERFRGRHPQGIISNRWYGQDWNRFFFL